MQRRHTANKERILNLFQGRHTLTVQQMCRLLPTIDESTVYRNIKRFVADGVLREVHANASTRTYERACDKHDHFVCNDCHGVAEIHVRRAVVKNMLPTGAVMQEGGVVVHGTCKRCIL